MATQTIRKGKSNTDIVLRNGKVIKIVTRNSKGNYSGRDAIIRFDDKGIVNRADYINGKCTYSWKR